MKVEQVYEIVNKATSEVLGKEAIAGADLTKVVEIGRTAIVEQGGSNVDNYVRSLIDHIGKVVFVNRPYSGRAPSVLMDGWEYGAILEKIDADIPKAEQNDAWNLQAGTTYNQDGFNPPTGVRMKFWNKRTTFDIPMSYMYDAVKSAFSNVTQLNAFFSMIATKIETSLTIKRDALIMYTIDNFIGGTLYAEYNDPENTTPYGNSSGVRAINLLYLYNNRPNSGGTTLTAAQALYSLDFLKFAAYHMRKISKRMMNVSTLYNIGGRVRHSAKDRQKVVLLDIFADAADVYLQSDTWHNEFVKFPNADVVSYWQGTGTDFDDDDCMSIHLNITDPTQPIDATHAATSVEVVANGILGVIFDRDALGVTNPERKVTSHYNGRGDFYNYWYKEFAGYFNDFDENGVVFFIADATA